VRSRLALVAVAAVLTVAVVALSLHYVDPFPPRRIVLATGQAGGTYEALGREYQRRLGREGLRVELRSSAGSIENLQRLLGGQADVAFVQGGTYPLVPDPEGRLVPACAYNLFYRRNDPRFWVAAEGRTHDP
jgi:TRAP-type uncharacterized transport system substrate-binding protein